MHGIEVTFVNADREFRLEVPGEDLSHGTRLNLDLGLGEVRLFGWIVVSHDSNDHADDTRTDGT